MTVSSALEHAWLTMEAGYVGNGLSRSLTDFGVRNSRMMLAIEGGCRELLFPTNEKLVASNLGITRGVKVGVRAQLVGATHQSFLVLRCQKADFHGVFRRFAASVMEQVSDADDPGRAALEAIQSWQAMFNRVASKNESMMLGLFGELHELLGLVQRNSGALFSWMGPYARPQDFINGEVALEVKTSRSLANAVQVHGLEQLWARPFKQLVLVSKHVVPDAAGQRLSDLVTQLVTQGVDADALFDRLEGFDVDEAYLSGTETLRFTHRSSRYFLVATAAAALTPESLTSSVPNGVSRIEYTLALNAEGIEELPTDAAVEFLTRLSLR